MTSIRTDALNFFPRMFISFSSRVLVSIAAALDSA
jgi:hypothetical protein